MSRYNDEELVALLRMLPEPPPHVVPAAKDLDAPVADDESVGSAAGDYGASPADPADGVDLLGYDEPRRGRRRGRSLRAVTEISS